MKNKLQRVLSAFVCIAMLAAGIPVWAEDAGSVTPPEQGDLSPASAPSGEQTQTLEALVIETEAPTETQAPADTQAPTEAPGTPTTGEGTQTDPAPAETAQASATPDPTAAPLTEEEKQAQLAAAIADLSNRLSEQGYDSDYEKALWIYSMMLANISAGEGETVYDAIIGCSANSLGYARAMEALMNAAGLECAVVSGADGSAWIVARLDGEWTHIHPYADDVSGSFGARFGLTDAVMAREFSWDGASLPACTASAGCFHVRAEGYAPFTDRDSLSALLLEAAANRADSLKLYNAASLGALSATVAEILAASAPDASASVSESGALAVLSFSYASPAETEAPVTEEDPAAEEDPASEEDPFDGEIPLMSLMSLSLEDAPSAQAAVTAEKIVPAAEKITIGLMEKVSVAGWTLQPEGAQDSVTYTSKSTKIASVSADGVVTGKRTGSTVITIATAGGLSCTVSVTVRKEPSSVSIQGDSRVMGVGQTQQLRYTLSKSGSAGTVTFDSLQPDIATVTAGGLVTAVSPGTVTVRATTYNGRKKTAEIQVLPAPTSVTPASPTMNVGVNDTLPLAYSLNEGSAGSVTFASSDETVAAVDAAGRVTGKKTGTATITLTAHNGVKGECAVTVVPEPAKVGLTAAARIIGVNEKLQLVTLLDPAGSASSLKFKSSNSKIVSVSEDGVITGKRTGSATITVSTYNGKTASLKFTVKKAPSSVSIQGDSRVMGVGQTQQLRYTLSKSGSAGTVTFTSLQPDIATVTENGLVTAVAPGSVTIQATTYNGKKKTGEIQILPAPTSITPALSTVSIGAQDSWVLGYNLNEGSAGSVTFVSSDKGIATVDADGTIHALKQGSTTISITTHNGVFCECTVNVAPAPNGLKLSADRSSIGVNEKLQLTPVLDPSGTVGTIKYKSSSTKIATVSADGVVTGKRAGTATITAKTYNGKTATIKISVKKAPSGVSIQGDSKVMGVGETQQLRYTLSKSGSVGSVTFTSLQPDVATVTADGLVTAVAPGSVTIQASTYNGKKKTAEIQVLSAPSSIVLERSALAMGAGQTDQIVGTINEGSAGMVRYRSDNPDIATVDAESGKVTAIKAGTARLVAYTYVSGVEAAATVEVKPAPTYVSLPYTSLSIGVGDRIQLSPEVDANAAASFYYKSSNSKYAKVSASGLITGVRTGTATITVATYNGKSFKLKVSVKKAPGSVKANPASITLGLGESLTLGATITSGSATTLSYESLNNQVVTVSPSGVASAVGMGEADVRITTHNGKAALCHITVAAAPTSVSLSALPDTMGVGQKASASVSLQPTGSFSNVRYSVISGDAVRIDASGRITAEKSGVATVRASTHVEGVYADHTITVLAAPKSISFPEAAYTVDINQTFQLAPILTKDTYASISYTVSKAGYFTVDENGLITPIQRGAATVTATTYNGLKATTKIVINDPYYPEAMALAKTPPAYMDIGESYTVSISISPSTAQAAIQWTSSEENVCKVDSNGKVTAVSYGQAVITGKSTRNPSLSVSFKIVVLGSEICLTMPTRRTGTGDISKTLAQIKAVRASAYNELERLYAAGIISKSDYNSRHGYIERAFDMHLMPWMTDTKELYWKAANSEGGLKDFKVGTVYYGLPYTQSNRWYNKTKAVNAGYFTNTGKGYYKLQGSKFASREYPGNDCSSFVSMAIWGTNSANSYNNTRAIATSSAYRTLSDWTDLRPGDIMNKSGSHVVMFLYYANADKSQIVIIEQGGGEEGTNTISCSIRNVSYYTSRGYKIRRVTSLGY